MCRTGLTYGHCVCGAALTCRDSYMCWDCYLHWTEIDDSELEDA